MLEYSRVFPPGHPFPYDRALRHEIEEHRKALDGTLFIDRVMKSLAISTKGKTYPPKSESALRQLHQQVCEAPMSIQHKQSVLYYLLLDLGAQGSFAQAFASESGMPTNYHIFMKGLWHMDRQDYQRALEYVAHPSLSPDFADDIVMTLVRHARDDDYSLALSYFYTVRPMLKSSLALELLFDAMVHTDVAEALLFSRLQPPHAREQLFRRWMRAGLEDGLGNMALVPLDSAEETWFEEYLTTGEGRGVKRGKDVLLMRRIACDRFADIGRQRPGAQWAAVLQGIKSGTEGHGD